MSLKSFFSALLASSGMLLAVGSLSPAEAFTFTFGSSSQSSESTATGASASVDFLFETGATAGQVDLTLDIANTTGQGSSFGDGATTSKLTGIGFDLINGVSFVNGSYDDDANNSGTAYFDFINEDNTLSPFGTFDIALTDNNNFAGGNANNALPEGLDTSVKLSLATSLSVADVETGFFNLFSQPNSGNSGNIVARFQQVDGSGSDKLLGGEISNGDGGDDNGGDDNDGDDGGDDNDGDDGGDDNGGPEPEPIPEPAAMAGLMAVGAGIVLNRRKKG